MFPVIILESYVYEPLSGARVNTRVKCASVRPLLIECVCVCVWM